LVKYYTRHQSLKHLWYQRYNSRTNSRSDGVVPWYAKEAYKSGAWKKGTEAAWQQLMKERELLYNNQNIAKAQIMDIESTASGSVKLFVNVDNPYAEKWDFGDVNEVTIKKSDENLFRTNYGIPEVGKIIYVTLDVYHKTGNVGFSYKIKYDESKSKQKLNNKKNMGGKNMDGELEPVNFDQGDYEQVLNGKAEMARGESLMGTSVVSEDEGAFNRGIECVENGIRILKSVNYNRPNYNQRQRFFVEEAIASGYLQISIAKGKWMEEVEIPNASNEEKKTLFNKHGEQLLKVAEAWRRLSEIRLQRAEGDDIIQHKIGMHAVFFNSFLAYKSFYKADSTDEKANLAIKFAEKAFKMYNNVPAERKDDNAVSYFSYQEKMIQNAKTSPESKKKLIEELLLDKTPSDNTS